MHARWVLCLTMAACAASADPSPPGKGKAAQRADAPGGAPCVEPLRADVQRGVAYAHSYQQRGAKGYGSAASRDSRRALKALGVTWLGVTPFGFSPSLQSTEVRHVGHYPGGESDERVEREILAAHAEGFQVMLKPHLWIAGGAWRGALAPAGAEGWRRWFDSYERWLLRYARMAARLDVALLCVGVEFSSSSGARGASWRRLIARVRGVYDGRLTYAANWDEAARVPFWDALDYVGVQFYPPLGEGSEAQLRARLEASLDALGRLSARVDRPVLLTEVGYRAVPAPERTPHAWPERAPSPSADERAQARAYARLLRAVNARPWLKGLYVWKWFTDPSSREEGASGFSPRGKLAALTLRSAYTGRCGAEPAAPAAR